MKNAAVGAARCAAPTDRRGDELERSKNIGAVIGLGAAPPAPRPAPASPANLTRLIDARASRRQANFHGGVARTEYCATGTLDFNLEKLSAFEILLSASLYLTAVTVADSLVVIERDCRLVYDTVRTLII